MGQGKVGWVGPGPDCLSLYGLAVVPAIEKLLSGDWKERFLGRSPMEAKDVKGEGWEEGQGEMLEPNSHY